MYVIGFVDNSFDLLPDYKTRLSRHGIELLFPDTGKSKSEIVDWVLENNVRCLMVDHKLRPNFDYVGTDLVAYMNSALPDLPCMILTAYQQESLNENLVIKNMIESRDILDATDLVEFCNKLKQAVDVFTKRLELHETEYRNLLEIKKSNTISAQQEERLAYLYRILRAYGEVDELPVELLHPGIEKKMDSLIGGLNDLLTALNTKKDGE